MESSEGTNTNDLAPTLSIAGVWQPVQSQYITSTYPGGLADVFAGILPLGPDGLEGMVLTGWAFDPGNTVDIPVDIALLAQQPDGTMLVETSQYFSDPTTNGGGSVIIADFNGEGPSIFLAAHNETPFIAEPSTVYLANGSGGFTHTVLPDAVMAHDANLTYIDGSPVVLTATFQPGDADPMYSWNGTGFSIQDVGLTGGGATPPPNDGYPGPDVASMSVAAADFDGNGQTEIVFGEENWGPGYQYQPTNAGTFVMYNFVNGAISASPIFIGTPYFNNKPAYSGYTSAIQDAKPTTTPRVWVDDFNHDGLPDIIAGEEIWAGDSLGNEASMLQMFQNEGNLTFKDVTDQMDPNYNTDTDQVDYDMQSVDIDHSGINTYMGGVDSFNVAMQNNFIIVNDGAGNLYFAMQSQFSQMATNVLEYMAEQFPQYPVSSQFVPDFQGYLTGSLTTPLIFQWPASCADSHRFSTRSGNFVDECASWTLDRRNCGMADG